MAPHGFDNHALHLVNRACSPASKLSLHPSCAVFPENLSCKAPPPLSVALYPGDESTPASPSVPPDLYDYFQWSAQDTPPSDLSSTAPVGAAGDDHVGNPTSTSLGAWYSFSKGFHTPFGMKQFSDQRSQPQRRPRLRRHGDISHDHHNSSCPYPCSHCTTCHVTRSVSPCVSPPHSPDSNHSTPTSPPFSEPEDACDHDVWDRPIAPCFVESLRPPPPPLPEHSHPNTGEITAEQVANGVDVQGIPWDTMPFSRADYRATRLTDQARNRESLDFHDGPSYHLKDPRRGARYYDFFSSARSVKCSIVHFQLRNLAWATSNHDVYVMYDGSVFHWDAAMKRKSKVMDLNGSETFSSGLGNIQISTMIAKDDLVIAGGFYGEMVAKNMTSGAIIHNKRITNDDNAITNAIDIFDRSILTSNNDCYVRCFDIETFQRKSAFSFGSPVNHATRQPDGKLVVVAGDDNVVQVIDGESGQRVSQLHGHSHFSFATGWHPNGRLFATGSQDKTCRVWDARNMSQYISVLGAHMGAVRSLRFTSCGRFMAMAEPRDFVHIYDVNRGLFDTCQEIDLFGEIAGIALSPCAEGLFVAVSDRLYSCLLEYERKSSSSLSDFVF